MPEYTLEIISQRFGNGWNYWRDMDSCALINVRLGAINLVVHRRERKIEQKVSEATFNKNIVEEPPVCGLTCTQSGLLHTTLLPLRHNQFNYNSQNIQGTFLSHPKAATPWGIELAFLPSYKSPDQIRSDILHGRTLGGAISDQFGISVLEDKPQFFFRQFPIGRVDLKNREVFIRNTGWSYFARAAKLLEPVFACKQEE